MSKAYKDKKGFSLNRHRGVHRQTRRYFGRHAETVKTNSQTQRQTNTDQVRDGHISVEIAADCDDASARVDVEVAGSSKVPTDLILDVALSKRRNVVSVYSSQTGGDHVMSNYKM